MGSSIEPLFKSAFVASPLGLVLPTTLLPCILRFPDAGFEIKLPLDCLTDLYSTISICR